MMLQMVPISLIFFLVKTYFINQIMLKIYISFLSYTTNKVSYFHSIQSPYDYSFYYISFFSFLFLIFL